MLRLVYQFYGQILARVAFDLFWIVDRLLGAVAIDPYVEIMGIHTKNSRSATFCSQGI